LAALAKQTRSVNEVIVTVRDIDTQTWDFFQQLENSGSTLGKDLAETGISPCSLPPAPCLLSLNLKTVTVTVTGVVAAMNAGMDAAAGDIIAFTDDDAAPRPDWLEKIETYFQADSNIGAVGGRDWQWVGSELKEIGESTDVGRLQWFGRVIGNHHFAVGDAREVDVIKGVNMSFRRTAIQGLRFDERMRGTGAQVHFELAFNLALRRRGWKIIFDPAVAVDHYPAQRFDEDQRDRFNGEAWSNAVHNETLVLLEHFSAIQRLVFVIWAFLIGTREALGIVQLLRLLLSEGEIAKLKWVASVRGRWQGLQTWREMRNIEIRV
jgi:cellulose synthase/poly-beta-1,6-N-acetylglucosamine synthase-like glycosyltransferase